jgi:4-aminobutyrate aminotransferase-like enzyme
MPQVVYFVNSGTEANELAMLMARLYSGNLSMVALRNAYHGGSAGTIGLTGLQTWKYPIPQVCVLHNQLTLQRCSTTRILGLTPSQCLLDQNFIIRFIYLG